MATKLYLRNITPTINPGGGAELSAVLPVGTGVATGTSVELSLLTAIGSSGTSISGPSAAQTAHQDEYMTRWMTLPLNGATFGSGTWTFGYNATESNVNANSFIALSLYVWRPSTTSVVGYIYDSDTALGVEFGNGVASTLFGQVPTFAGSNVTSAPGDILILEVWVHAVQGSASSFTNAIKYDGTTEPTTASTEASTASYLLAPIDIPFYIPTAPIKQSSYRVADSSGNVVQSMLRWLSRRLTTNDVGSADQDTSIRPVWMGQSTLRRPDSTINVIQSNLRWQSDRLTTNDLGSSDQDTSIRPVWAAQSTIRRPDSTINIIQSNLRWQSDRLTTNDLGLPDYDPNIKQLRGYSTPYQLYQVTPWNRLRPVVADQSDQSVPDADPTITHPPKQLPYQLYYPQSWQRLKPVVVDQSDQGVVDADPTVTRQLRAYSTPYQLYYPQNWQRLPGPKVDQSTLADTNIAGSQRIYIGSDPTWGSQQQVMRQRLGWADQSDQTPPPVDADPTIRPVKQIPYQLYDRTYWVRQRLVVADQSDATDPTTLPIRRQQPYQLYDRTYWIRLRPTVVDQSDQGTIPDADPTVTHPPKQIPYQLYDRTYWNRLRPIVADQSGAASVDADPTVTRQLSAYANPYQLHTTEKWYRRQFFTVDQSTLQSNDIAFHQVLYIGSDQTWSAQQQVQWRLHLADQSDQPAVDADPTVVRRVPQIPYQLYDRTYWTRTKAILADQSSPPAVDADPTVRTPWAYANPYHLRFIAPWNRTRPVVADQSDQTPDADPNIKPLRAYSTPYQLYYTTPWIRTRPVLADQSSPAAVDADPTLVVRLKAYATPWQLYDRTYWNRIRPVFIDQSEIPTPPPPQVFPPSGPGGGKSLGRRGPWYPDRTPEQVLREEEEIICLM